MEEKKRMIPTGNEDFRELRDLNYYYVDKTGLIKELLINRKKVTMFTRPRRFGKTLNMSMLANFFSMEGDKHIFDGLEISKEKELCDKYMGKYPVIFISLKDIEAPDFETAYEKTVLEIIDVVKKTSYLKNSNKLSQNYKNLYTELSDSKMPEDVLGDSLRTLSQLLQMHFGKKVVILIDEYDVPLQKAYVNGYYDQMVPLIRSIFSAALKSNTSLEFAVLTGCLRVSKESIFTGLNNLNVLSVDNVRCAEYFGFTDEEVRNMLDYYGFSDRYDSVKEWYDGYQFGNSKIYCPWDILFYCEDLKYNPNRQPQKYWANTSGNEAIKQFIEISNVETKKELERLLAGEILEKEINENLTYQDMYSNINNLWSLFYATGYLTQCGEPKDGKHRLVIPNKEIYTIFKNQIEEYFNESLKADTAKLNKLYNALKDGDAETVEEIFTGYLKRSISLRDYAVKKDEKEGFYHAVMTNILTVNDSWKPVSNREAGIGYADILVKSEDKRLGIIIELKHADADNKMDKACLAALKQIEDRRYAEYFSSKTTTIRKYGIGCCEKSCRVMLGE